MTQKVIDCCVLLLDDMIGLSLLVIIVPDLGDLEPEFGTHSQQKVQAPKNAHKSFVLEPSWGIVNKKNLLPLNPKQLPPQPSPLSILLSCYSSSLYSCSWEQCRL